jgi:hypothetical protein
MLTINKNVSLSKTNAVVSFDLGKLPEGEYQLLLVVDDNPKKSTKQIWFPNFNTEVNTSQNFSRTEIYGDNGR